MTHLTQSTTVGRPSNTSRLSPVTRRRLEMQGYVGYDDEWLAEIGPWLRLTPGTFAIWAGLATLAASPMLMWSLALVTLVGAFTRYSLADRIYNVAVRRVTGTRPIPPAGPPRRFSMGLAAALFFAAGIAFYAGALPFGYALGVFMTAATLPPALADLCIGALIYHACRRPFRA
jgi:hypothetical protein